jgi:hypothetical protein
MGTLSLRPLKRGATSALGTFANTLLVLGRGQGSVSSLVEKEMAEPSELTNEIAVRAIGGLRHVESYHGRVNLEWSQP